MKKVSFIGAGSMAEAIISGIISSGFIQAEQVFVTNHTNQKRLKDLHKKYGIQAKQDKATVVTDADIIILSMKPNDVATAIESIKQYIKPNQLIISVIAGLTTSHLLTLLEEEMPIVRVMPNTSASIGFSATALTPGKHTSKQQLSMSEGLFKTIGMTTIIEEQDMHTVTSIAGSGPAYIYYLVEAMEEAAVESGLEKDVAQELIMQTVLGAGQMLKHSGKSATTLKREITSPSGTTEAGLKALAKYDFKETIAACVKSARNRSIELSEQLEK